MYDKKACGRRLKQLRQERNMTQAELAREVGMSPDTISKIEQGRRSPSIMNICVFAKYYGTTTDYVLLGVEGKGYFFDEWIRMLPVEKRRKVEKMIDEIKGLVE